MKQYNIKVSKETLDMIDSYKSHYAFKSRDNAIADVFSRVVELKNADYPESWNEVKCNCDFYEREIKELEKAKIKLTENECLLQLYNLICGGLLWKDIEPEKAYERVENEILEMKESNKKLQKGNDELVSKIKEMKEDFLNILRWFE